MNIAKRLDNGNVQILNEIGNEVGAQFGSDKKNNLETAATLFGNEFAKAAAASNVAVSDREDIRKRLSDVSSPTQFRGVVQTAKQLLDGKRDAMKHQYDEAKRGNVDFGSGGGAAQSTRPPLSDFEKK